MIKIKKIFSQFEPHPFLFAAYPVLALLAFNISEVSASVIFRPLILTLFGAMTIFLFSNLIFKERQRAALFTSCAVFLFFLYGHIYDLTREINIAGVNIIHHRTLVPVWAILLALGFWWAKKTVWLESITKSFNLISTILVLFSLFQITSGLIFQHNQLANSPINSPVLTAAPQNSPDIYYIILDAYGRADVLQNAFGFDNSAFVSNLESMGFYVARCSQSNYAQTSLSLSSSLNFNYLDALGAAGGAESKNLAPLMPLIKHSEVRQFLAERGYKTVAFATGFNWTEISDADQFLAPPSHLFQINEFEFLVLHSTAWRVVLDTKRRFAAESAAVVHRERILFALDALTHMQNEPAPKFVFAHLVIPHPPFVFSANGEPVMQTSTLDNAYTKADYIQGYSGQVAFINTEILKVIKSILENSSRPPIIIIQGDHGPGNSSRSDRMANLNAYYLPETSILYSTITPVNSFRIIFNTYFGQSFPLLEDISLYSDYNTPYKFKKIENDCK